MIARLLSPEDYSITAIPIVFVVIVGLLIGSGFANTMVRKPDLTEKDLATVKLKIQKIAKKVMKRIYNSIWKKLE